MPVCFIISKHIELVITSRWICDRWSPIRRRSCRRCASPASSSPRSKACHPRRL